MKNDNTRLATTVSDAVDETILMYEQGQVELAVRTLSHLGFKALDVHRILKNPEQRRRYINDMITGY
ncbi:hypothetical protein ACI3PL_20680 [Lacticaseibacillus paracasei]